MYRFLLQILTISQVLSQPSYHRVSNTARLHYVITWYPRGVCGTSYCTLRDWFWGITRPPIAECMYEMEICDPDRPQMIIPSMLHNWSYTHTHTHTHTQYDKFIAFPLQQLLHKRDSLLRHTYTVCLVYDCTCLKTEISAFFFKKVNNVTP